MCAIFKKIENWHIALLEFLQLHYFGYSMVALASAAIHCWVISFFVEYHHLLFFSCPYLLKVVCKYDKCFGDFVKLAYRRFYVMLECQKCWHKVRFCLNLSVFSCDCIFCHHPWLRYIQDENSIWIVQKKSPIRILSQSEFLVVQSVTLLFIFYWRESNKRPDTIHRITRSA